ncbi:SDR family NAD(P)-dependent oxidoreductase [Actinopolymorpha alba]|uniref:SDR family NAD(P)-dependent oxidoreductase n=1 Tax=Actinopolymorpha alba TaxID=533267 RepID=UPI00037A8FCA|nr:SDR family oxidoreductase [Actinopolymorpha alba]
MPTALVTGPTAGLGRAYAEALAGRGFDLVLVARDVARLTALADELTGRYAVRCEVLAADLADRVELRAVEERLADGTPGVDLLLNNAGFGLGAGFRASSVDDEQRLLDVLAGAVLRLTKAALPGMLERRSGTIVNVSSVAGFAPYGTYGAVKAWVTAFSEGITSDLAGTGIRVLAVCPGYVRTEFHERAGLRVQGMPSWMWLRTNEVVDATFRHLDAGRRSPVLVPTLRYRALVAATRHFPRSLVLAVARGVRMRTP